MIWYVNSSCSVPPLLPQVFLPNKNQEVMWLELIIKITSKIKEIKFIFRNISEWLPIWKYFSYSYFKFDKLKYFDNCIYTQLQVQIFLLILLMCVSIMVCFHYNLGGNLSTVTVEQYCAVVSQLFDPSLISSIEDYKYSHFLDICIGISLFLGRWQPLFWR